MKTYRAVMLTKKNGPKILQVVELPLQEPKSNELRVQMRATGVSATDLTMLDGSYPFAPRIPFVPKYEVANVVDAIGAGVSEFSIGQRVARCGVGRLCRIPRAKRSTSSRSPVVSTREAAAVIPTTSAR
jgi:NADPH:quinone reductase-like Zn-dependent oxidoreductase